MITQQEFLTVTKQYISIFERLTDPDKGVCESLIEGKVPSIARIHDYQRLRLPQLIPYFTFGLIGRSLIKVPVRAEVVAENDDCDFVIVIGMISEDVINDLREKTGLDEDGETYVVAAMYDPRKREGCMYLTRELHDSFMRVTQMAK